MALLLEIVLATLANVLIGWLWYSKPLFGDVWQRIVYPTSKDRERMRTGMVPAMVIGIFAALVLSTVISTMSGVLEVVRASQALGLGLVLWSAIMVPILQANFYQDRDRRLLLIDGGFQLVATLAMTFIVLAIR